MIYFTADLHFYHDNVIKFANRPFENSQQMNKALIKNWNDKIKPTDEVYILGDFTMKGHALAQEILYQLKGKKHLIKGNHDGFINSPHFENYLFESISDYKEINYMNTQFILFHYPILEWDSFFRGSIHLHGHQHNHADYNLQNLQNGIRRYDVGVDANNMSPVGADEIIAFFNSI